MIQEQQAGLLLKELQQRISDLEAQLEVRAGNVWYWQGDGKDYAESLTCPVVIRADDLRKLLARAHAADELEQLFDRQHQAAEASYVAAHPRPDCPHGYKPDLGELIECLIVCVGLRDER